jgi:hypothetical protein
VVAAVISTICRFLGISPLLFYTVLAALAALGIWGWNEHVYNKGYSAGETQERSAWQEQRKKDQDALDVAKKAAQDAIDALATDRQLAAQAEKDAQANADLAKEQAASPTKKLVCLPRKVARALNRIGR